MDDPGWSWPAWKFGMRRDDLFTKLHDQYNTFPSSIQDPEAFHHDVYEISQEASSADDFHRMMADRKKQRLQELNLSLESASVEIIANPNLIGTEQWRYAIQLFQTKSLDSLVRYFASYLPEDHPWHHGSSSESESEMSGSVDSLAPSTVSTASFFSSVHEDDDHKPILTHEPLPISSIAVASTTQLPPSPRSMTMRSDASIDSVDSPIDLAHHEYLINTLTPARTMSFSESDSERLDKTMPMPSHLGSEDDDVVQVDTPLTAVSDVSDGDGGDEVEESRPSFDEIHISHDECTLTSKSTTDLLDSETPTPRPEHVPHDPMSSSFIALTSSGRRRGQSPPRRSSPAPSSKRTSTTSSSRRSREDSPVLHQTIKSRGPGEPVSRIQKPLPEGMGMRGARPRCSRRKAGGVDC